MSPGLVPFVLLASFDWDSWRSLLLNNLVKKPGPASVSGERSLGTDFSSSLAGGMGGRLSIVRSEADNIVFCPVKGGTGPALAKSVGGGGNGGGDALGPMGGGAVSLASVD